MKYITIDAETKEIITYRETREEARKASVSIRGREEGGILKWATNS